MVLIIFTVKPKVSTAASRTALSGRCNGRRYAEWQGWKENPLGGGRTFILFNSNMLILAPVHDHPRRLRGGQSGREKRWKRSSRLLIRPDWLPLGHRGWFMMWKRNKCVTLSGVSRGRVRGSAPRPPLIRRDAWLRLKFLHWQDRISLCWFLMKRTLHFATKISKPNSRDIQNCNCFWVLCYHLFASARKADRRSREFLILGVSNDFFCKIPV